MIIFNVKNVVKYKSMDFERECEYLQISMIFVVSMGFENDKFYGEGICIQLAD